MMPVPITCPMEPRARTSTMVKPGLYTNQGLRGTEMRQEHRARHNLPAGSLDIMPDSTGLSLRPAEARLATVGRRPARPAIRQKLVAPTIICEDIEKFSKATIPSATGGNEKQEGSSPGCWKSQ